MVLGSIVCLQLLGTPPTPTPTPTVTEADAGSSATLYVVIILVILGLLLGVVGFGLWLRRRQRPPAGGGGWSSLLLGDFSGLLGGTQQRDQYRQDELAGGAFPLPSHIREMPHSAIQCLRVIADSPVSTISMARLAGDNETVLVAVKKWKTESTNSYAYIQVHTLSRLSHARILTLIGVCNSRENGSEMLIVVTEYMDKTDLRTVLQATTPSQLTWASAKAAYCLHVCEAMLYLHSLSPVVVHGDLKAENVLVDTHKGAKLYHLFHERPIQTKMSDAELVLPWWSAPELILGRDHTRQTDIYSFGVLLTELDTHLLPFENAVGLVDCTTTHKMLIQVARGTLRPTVSDSCPQVIRQLVQDCLQFDPLMRPSAASILQTIQAWTTSYVAQ